MAKSIVVFNKFDGGELGRKGFVNVPPNSFTANNIYITDQGTLTVRPGLREVSPAGLSNGKVNFFMLTSTGGADALFIQGNTVRTFDKNAVNNLRTSATTLATTPTGTLDGVQSGSDIYIVNPGDKAYKITPASASNPTVTALASAPGGNAITTYGTQLVIANKSGNVNRVFYSAQSDFTSWPSTNFFDVGFGTHVAALGVVRGNLICATQNGFWIVTGGVLDGTNNVLRQQTHMPGPVRPPDMRISTVDLAWFAPIASSWPANFNGSLHNIFRDLYFSARTPQGDSATAPNPPTFGVNPLGGVDDGCFYIDLDGKVALLNNGVWTYHTFPGGYTLTGFNGPNQPYPQVYLCDGGGVSATPRFFVFDTSLNRPGFESDTFARAGDMSTSGVQGSVTFPEYWDRQAGELHVRYVYVDIVKYNTGGSQNNHLDMTISAYRRYDGGTNPSVSTTQSFDEAVSSATTNGTYQRLLFAVGDQDIGNGFTITLSNVRGLEIQRVEVIADVMAPRV